MDESDGSLGVEAEGGVEGAHLGGEFLAVGGEGVDPEEAVGAFGGGDDLGLGHKVHGGHELLLGLVDFAGCVAVEDGAEGLLEGGDEGLAGLPGGGGSEEKAVPVLVGEGFAVVVPKGVELAGGPGALAREGELLDVGEAEVEVGVDLAVVVDGGGDPGFDSGVGEGMDDFAKPADGVGGVAPGDGDGGVLEGLGHGFELGGGVLRDVSPEEEAAVEGLEGGDDLLHEVEVDGGAAAGVDVGFGLAYAELDGLVGSEMEERAGGVVGG